MVTTEPERRESVRGCGEERESFVIILHSGISVARFVDVGGFAEPHISWCSSYV